jgi:hypothetical protein
VWCIELKLPSGVLGAGGVVAAVGRQHPGDVLVAFDGGDEEFFYLYWILLLEVPCNTII